MAMYELRMSYVFMQIPSMIALHFCNILQTAILILHLQILKNNLWWLDSTFRNSQHLTRIFLIALKIMICMICKLLSASCDLLLLGVECKILPLMVTENDHMECNVTSWGTSVSKCCAENFPQKGEEPELFCVSRYLFICLQYVLWLDHSFLVLLSPKNIFLPQNVHASLIKAIWQPGLRLECFNTKLFWSIGIQNIHLKYAKFLF